MSKEKPGIIRRFFRLLGGVFSLIRWLLNAVIAIVMVVLIINLFAQDAKPLPEKAALTLVPSGTLVEQRTFADPITQLMEQSSPYDAETPIHDLIESLDTAKNDKRVTALVLDLNHLQQAGLSKLQEVGQALERFRASGKPVIAYADTYDQSRYYLASFADEVYLNPMGGVLITGFGYYGTYLQEALDKLHINFHIFRAGTYKSAVEPFTRNSMSNAARENAASWLNDLWAAYTARVEQLRDLPPGFVERYVAELPESLATAGGDLARLALDKGLVDHLATRTELTEKFKSRVGVIDNDYAHIDHKTYLSHLRLPTLQPGKQTQPAIGVIVANGNIVDGPQPEGTIGSETLSNLLQRAREDSSLKALVLRIDSPGGSAFASEVIRNEISETQKIMPVYVSMGSMAASGGYWIAAGANQIWATPTTLTGSIGVFGLVPTFENSLEKLGIHSDGIGTTSIADMNRLDRPLSPQAAQILQLSVDNIYNRFLSLVAQGRESTIQSIEQVAEGRVWTGQQALERGLVDALGTLQDTIEGAAKAQNLEHWQVKHISRPLTFQEQFLKQLAGSAVSLPRWLGTDAWHRKLMNLLPTGEFAELISTDARDPHNLYLKCLSCVAP